MQESKQVERTKVNIVVCVHKEGNMSGKEKRKKKRKPRVSGFPRAIINSCVKYLI